MQIGTTGYEKANLNALQNANINPQENKELNTNQKGQKEPSLEEQINKSAVEVSLSMGAQIILLMMDSQQKASSNTSAQKDILDFLSGKKVSEDFNLANTGYTGKPITELTKEEATELVGDDGFFGIEKTANRVADFVFSFSGDDLEKLEAGRKGIVQGFEDAQKMWGGELPEISHKTQAKTLELIDAKIAELKGETTPQKATNTSTSNEVDITV
jgi:hypothetical protein